MKHSRQRTLATLALVILAACSPIIAPAATIFESGTLGPTGLPQGAVPASNITSNVFAGVRFQLTVPVETTNVGGHFVSQTGGSFFGAIFGLDDENDFPDSSDPNAQAMEALGHALLTFPTSSAEVFGNLNLSLGPGWYALVFGSGLFNANGDGAAPLNNPDIGSPEYIAFQPGAGWFNLFDLSDAILFVDFRFVVTGSIVPEPSTIAFAVVALLIRIKP